MWWGKKTLKIQHCLVLRTGQPSAPPSVAFPTCSCVYRHHLIKVDFLLHEMNCLMCFLGGLDVSCNGGVGVLTFIYQCGCVSFQKGQKMFLQHSHIICVVATVPLCSCLCLLSKLQGVSTDLFCLEILQWQLIGTVPFWKDFSPHSSIYCNVPLIHNSSMFLRYLYRVKSHYSI